MEHLHKSRPTDLPPQAWPEGLPNDLRLRLLDALSYREVTPADLWDEMREWLEAHGVPVPSGITSQSASSTTSERRLTGLGAPWSY